MIEVTDASLQKAAGEGMDEFIQVFTDKYKEVIGGELTAETMPLLTGEQHSLLAYQIFRDEVMFGGFCQLIQNGYGGYIFDNPFAKVMRLWGAEDFSKLVYKAKKIYDAHRHDLEKERTEDEFMAMYEQYEAFDDLEEEYLDILDTLPKDNQYLEDNDPNKFIAKMGAEAIYDLLARLDLDALSYELRHRAGNDASQQRKNEALKRLQVVESFRASRGRNKPEWMIVRILSLIHI